MLENTKKDSQRSRQREEQRSVWLRMEFQITCFLPNTTYKLPNIKMAINMHSIKMIYCVKGRKEVLKIGKLCQARKTNQII